MPDSGYITSAVALEHLEKMKREGHPESELLHALGRGIVRAWLVNDLTDERIIIPADVWGGIRGRHEPSVFIIRPGQQELYLKHNLKKSVVEFGLAGDRFRPNGQLWIEKKSFRKFVLVGPLISDGIEFEGDLGDAEANEQPNTDAAPRAGTAVIPIDTQARHRSPGQLHVSRSQEKRNRDNRWWASVQAAFAPGSSLSRVVLKVAKEELNETRVTGDVERLATTMRRQIYRLIKVRGPLRPAAGQKVERKN